MIRIPEINYLILYLYYFDLPFMSMKKLNEFIFINIWEFVYLFIAFFFINYLIPTSDNTPQNNLRGCIFPLIAFP